MFRRPDVPPDIPRKLYRGEWTVQDHIDLHGLFVDEARDAVGLHPYSDDPRPPMPENRPRQGAITPKAVKVFLKKWSAAGCSKERSHGLCPGASA